MLFDDVHGYKEIACSILTTDDRQPISVEGRAPYESIPAQESNSQTFIVILTDFIDNPNTIQSTLEEALV